MADRVLITGARAAAALDLARDFQAAGWEPHLADCSPSRIARWSGAAAGFHRYPSPVRDRQGFRERIAAVAQDLDMRLVVPACEEVFHLAAPALADRLGERLFAPPLALLRRLHDKLAFAQACAAWRLPAPESHPIDDANALRRFATDAAEWVFKPRFSRFGEAALVGLSRARLDRLRIAPGRPWLAQRRVRGSEASFYAVARDGTLSAFAAYQSGWRMRGGASYAFEPLASAQQARLEALAASLAGAAELTGQFACDAIFDTSGEAWLIECNPRATSGVHLLAGDGRVARAMTGPGAERARQRASSAHLAPAMIMFGLPAALATARLGPWRRVLAGGSDVLARPGDRWPMIGAVFDTIGFSLDGVRHGISMSAAATRDIEWNGEDLS